MGCLGGNNVWITRKAGEMFQRPRNILKIDLPIKRPFSWRLFFILVGLYFLGNVAGVPLLRKTNAPVEPLWFWFVATLIAALLIALSLLMANRVGLGAPFLEGRLSREALPHWLRSGLALTVLMVSAGAPFSLIANLNIEADSYPFGWELLGASFKAGVVEEAVYRLLVVSSFVWIGKFFLSDEEGRPTNGVYWAGIVLAGLMFGWAHVDARLANSGTPLWGYALIMVLSSALGIYFGWLFWQLGLEWAIFAHFAYDAFVSMILVPVYLLASAIVWMVLWAVLLLASTLAWRYLAKGRHTARSLEL